MASALMKTATVTCLLLAAVTTTASQPSEVRGDFDGDGVEDEARLIQYKDHVSVSIQQGGNVGTQILQFRIDPAAQDAICGLPAELSVSPLACNQVNEPLPGCKELPGAVALSLRGGDCDAIHMYWDHGAERMTWWRR